MDKVENISVKATKAYDKFLLQLRNIGYIETLSADEVKALVAVDPAHRKIYEHPLAEEMREGAWQQLGCLDKFKSSEPADTQKKVLPRNRSKRKYVVVE